MAGHVAPYACDRCKSRKVSCCRRHPACQRCQDRGVPCTYTRSGVIRRNRKRKHEVAAGNPAGHGTDNGSHIRPASQDGGPEPHLAADIEVTRETLHDLGDCHHTSLSALSSLSETCAAVWHNALELDNSKTYFLFKDQAEAWAEVFASILDQGRPLMTPAPPNVLEHLRASQPEQVRDRAWLVLYYSLILSMVSSTKPKDLSTKEKLRCNLWLALNDVRLLLEPREVNIQALVLLACRVEEFTTPALCWMLITNACRMLQAIGVNQRRLDARTRERRTMMFWHLNLVDKALALIFRRPPTFHQAMAKEVPLPNLEQLLPFQPHQSSMTAPKMFGAHYVHQAFLCSQVMADIWSCLYNESAVDDKRIESVRLALMSWYQQARTILEAAALAEKPFLDALGAASVDLGLRTNRFSYLYLLILLTRSSHSMRKECMDASKEMLHLLEHIVSDSEEPYNGIVWQLLCGPFTAFLTLFGEVLSRSKGGLAVDEGCLAAMEHLPIFLHKMSQRNPLAPKLERVAMVFVKHARAILQHEATIYKDTGTEGDAGYTHFTSPNTISPVDDMAWDSFFNHAMPLPMLEPLKFDQCDVHLAGLATWADGCAEDATVDWVGWDS